MSTLIIGEKPSVARALSSVVGAANKRKGYVEGNNYTVSWCLGHLVGLKYPNDYSNHWSDKWSFSQLPMIPDKWLFKVTDSTKEQFAVLKNLMCRNDITETPATRAGTIEGLVTKGYAKRKGKQIVATEKGVRLIDVVSDEVKSAKLTSDWEMKLQQIEQGQYSADTFMLSYNRTQIISHKSPKKHYNW